MPLDFIVDTASSVNIVLPQFATSLNAPRTGVTTDAGVGGTGVMEKTYEVTPPEPTRCSWYRSPL